jgi:hypothetical protein
VLLIVLTFGASVVAERVSARGGAGEGRVQARLVLGKGAPPDEAWTKRGDRLRPAGALRA